MLTHNTAIQFRYDPTESLASTRQITLLLQGLGYDQATCVHDEDTGMIVVIGQKFGSESLDSNEHEVSAICNVLGQWVDVEYCTLSPIRKLVYGNDGNVRWHNLEKHS